MWKPDTPNGTTGTATTFPQGGFQQVNPTAVANGPGGHYVTFNNLVPGQNLDTWGIGGQLGFGF